MSGESEWQEIEEKIDTWYLQCRNVSEYTEKHPGKQPIPEEMRDELHNLGSIVFGMLDGVPQPKNAGKIWKSIQQFKGDYSKLEEAGGDFTVMARAENKFEKIEPNKVPTKDCGWQPIGNQSGSWEVKG